MNSINPMSSVNPMHEWFKYLFTKQMDANGYVNCFECGKPMHQEQYMELTTCYSHILPKSTYPGQAGNPENVKIVHPACHDLYTNLPSNAIKQYTLYLQLKEKYKKYE